MGQAALVNIDRVVGLSPLRSTCAATSVIGRSHYNVHSNWLLFIARQHTVARYWYSNSVRPSVCPSVRDVPVSDENGLTYRHRFFSPYGSPIILVLPASNIFTKFRRGHPPTGALNTGGIWKFRDFLPISRYISQAIQDIAIVTM